MGSSRSPGDALDPERVQADCRLGVLTLTIPVAETAKPRQVPVGGQETETIVPPPAGGAAASPAERPASTAAQAAPNGNN
jgi:hypothetical protein